MDKPDEEQEERKVILAVDDMGLNLRTIKLTLEDSFRVLLAKTGDMALTLTKVEQIDLILLDIEMPGMSGFDFMQRLKTDITVNEIPPVIFVTAHATPELLYKAKLAGACGYVVKPFDPEVLRQKVNDVLGLSKTLEDGFVTE